MAPLVRSMLVVVTLATTGAADPGPGGCGGGTVVAELPRQYETQGAVTLPAVDFSCAVDTDCTVKDVRNCCGYYPRCVNRDFEPDIGAVQQYCMENAISSVCGYPEIDTCECHDNICRSMQGGDEV